MSVSERFSELPEYPFARLRALLGNDRPGGTAVDMSVGEPRHPFPVQILDAIRDGSRGFGRYPPGHGSPELLRAVSRWMTRRYGVEVDPATQLISLSGTREGLFIACLALCPLRKNGQLPVVLIPNPFYQVYAAGAAASNAEAVYVSATRATGFLPDYWSIPEEVLARTSIAYLCSPSNPQGSVADKDYLVRLIRLAERHDFQILADECYSEIYRDLPPPGAMQVAAEIGADMERVVVFHSLSKRSNLPGLRSGFMAGGPETISRVKFLRSYSGASLPSPIQAASAWAWQDEDHVERNRDLYRDKFGIVESILGDVPGYETPEAGFFIWFDTGSGEAFAARLWSERGVRVLPGAYLGRKANEVNPGSNYIRAAIVAGSEELRTGLLGIRSLANQLGAGSA